MQNKRRFIPTQQGEKSIRVFDATTGQLYKIITVGGKITGQPICTETELYVQIEKGNKQFLEYYKLPSVSLTRVIPIN